MCVPEINLELHIQHSLSINSNSLKAKGRQELQPLAFGTTGIKQMSQKGKKSLCIST